MTSHEFRDSAPCLSTFQNLQYLSLYRCDSLNLNPRIFPACFSLFSSHRSLTIWCPVTSVYTGSTFAPIIAFDLFSHLEELSFLNFDLYSPPKFRTPASFTGGLRVSVFTGKGLMLLSYVSWKSRGLAFKYALIGLWQYDQLRSPCRSYGDSLPRNAYLSYVQLSLVLLSWPEEPQQLYLRPHRP